MSNPGSAIVVGGGPAGATLAYLFASRGLDVTLLERQRDFAREFRGEVLLPSGVDALGQMQLRGALDAVPHVEPSSITLFANAREVFRVDVDPATFGGDPPTAMSQPAFLEAVIDAASAHPSFRVVLGASVGDLLLERGRVVGVTARVDGEERELRASVVVGADGRSSVVRRRGGLRAHRQGIDVDVVWFKVPRPDFMRDGAPARAYIGRAHLLLAYCAADGMLQVAWVIEKGSFGELKRQGVDEWCTTMAEHVTPDLAEHLAAHRGALTHPFLLSTVSDRVERWTRPGALVIGDAAHTMSPVGGQGVNIALRDAIVAANHLVPALRAGGEPDAIDSAALAVECERSPEVVAIQRMQALPPRVLMARTWWSALLRRVVPRLLSIGAARADAARLIQPLLFGRGEVRLVV